MILTQDIAYKEITTFFQKNPTPLVVFGTGISCAIDWRFGMNNLKDELINKIPALIKGSTPMEKEWADVVLSLNANADLEHGLDNVRSDELLNFIIDTTSKLITTLDKEFCFKIYNNDVNWPADKLFKRLVDGLPSTDRTLHVVTPNYDMLAEYSFEKNKIPFINGFFGIINKCLNWEQSRHSIRVSKEITQIKNRQKTELKELKHINLYKVHGSINTFLYNNEVVENNLWIFDPPMNCERVMVTPGISKLGKVINFRKELFGSFDGILEKKDAFLFIGYGFNDSHIETYIQPKLKTQKCHGLIITRDTNDRIQNLLYESDNLWLVCMEEVSGTSGTRIFNKQYDDWLYLYDKQLWNIKEFTKEIIGD